MHATVQKGQMVSLSNIENVSHNFIFLHPSNFERLLTNLLELWLFCLLFIAKYKEVYTECTCLLKKNAKVFRMVCICKCKTFKLPVCTYIVLFFFLSSCSSANWELFLGETMWRRECPPFDDICELSSFHSDKNKLDDSSILSEYGDYAIA